MKAHENPFATSILEHLLFFDPSLIGDSWEAIEERWERHDYQAAIVGHHGSGKTTFLESFANHLEGKCTIHQLFLNDQKKKLSNQDWELLNKSSDAFYFIDGEEYLSVFERRSLYKILKQANGYLTALHKQSKLPTLLELKANLALAQKLLFKLPLKNKETIQNQLSLLLKNRQNNLREVWMDCYDII